MGNDTPRTVEIPLTQGFVAIVDECDADLANLCWQALNCGKGSGSKRYAAHRTSTREGRKYIFIHKIVFERKYGRPPTKQEYADHIDCDPFNNTRDNIRPATPKQSSSNRRCYAKSGFKGVTKSGKKWVAAIGHNKQVIYLGTFCTPEEAHEAYKEAAIELHGEYARWE